MKKICFTLIWLVMLVTQSFAQIQITNSGKAKSHLDYYKELTFIKQFDDGYYFLLKDYNSRLSKLDGEQYYIKLFLGKTKEDVKQSYITLQNWWNNAQNDDFIIVTNPNGQQVCIYRYNANIYMSYGDERDCKRTRTQFGLDVAFLDQESLLVRNQQFINNVALGDIQLTGFCSFKKKFLKSLKNYPF